MELNDSEIHTGKPYYFCRGDIASCGHTSTMSQTAHGRIALVWQQKLSLLMCPRGPHRILGPCEGLDIGKMPGATAT